ncbi:unnamed protein product, partial [Sphagnum balticum]
QLNSQKRKTLGMPTYPLSNGKRSAIKPFTPPRQVAVSGSGTLARPTSSLQPMTPAGNKLQKATEFKHPAGLSSWDVGQGSTSGQDLQVPSSSITLQVQHSRARDSSSEMRQTGICRGRSSIQRTLQMLISPKLVCIFTSVWK